MRELKDLNLSTRTYNALIKVGITTDTQILELTENDMKNIQGMGQKSLKELCEVKEKIKKYEKYSPNLIELSTLLELDIESLYIVSLDYNNTYEILKFLILKNSYFKNKLLDYLYKFLSFYPYGVLKDCFIEKLPVILQYQDIIDEAIRELEQKDQVEIRDNFLILKNIKSLEEELKPILDANKIKIFIDRINGRTLNEIAKDFNVTRERIRQIECKVLSILKDKKLGYDKYLEIVQKYDFKKEDIYKIFGKEICNFIELRFGLDFLEEERIPLEEILNDVEISNDIKNKINNLLNEDILVIDGEKIKLTKKSLMEYFLKKNAAVTINLEKFKEMYNDFLDTYCQGKIEKLKNRDYENAIKNRPDILSKLKNTIRYYDIENKDMKKFLTTLELTKYKNIEYSSLKIFRDNLDLMKEYDVQDEYELHNLLKKICKDNKNFSNIKFSRMPIIQFGKVDRMKQAKDLYLKLAPISFEDFSKEYDRIYGIDENTVKANIVPRLKEINNNVEAIEKQSVGLMHKIKKIVDNIFKKW